MPSSPSWSAIQGMANGTGRAGGGSWLSVRSYSPWANSCTFWQADYIAKSGWIGHAPFAFWLMSALRPRIVVELGTHLGFSYFVFCQAVKALSLDARCYAVDTWQDDESSGSNGEDVYEKISLYNSIYSTFSTLIRSTFDEVIDQFSDATIDLLHIDGQQSYEGAKRDFNNWMPKLSSRSVVLIHDTNSRSRGFGVFRLWEELRSSSPNFEFMHSHGLGVLGCGADLPDAVKVLFEAARDPSETSEIRKIYSRLGTPISDLYDATRLIDQLRASRTEDKAELSRLNGVTGDLRERLASSEITLADISVKYGSQRALAKSLEGRLSTRETDARNSFAELAARKVVANDLGRKLRAREAQNKQLKSELQALQQSRGRRLTSPGRAILSLAHWLRLRPALESTGQKARPEGHPPGRTERNAQPVPTAIPAEEKSDNHGQGDNRRKRSQRRASRATQRQRKEPEAKGEIARDSDGLRTAPAGSGPAEVVANAGQPTIVFHSHSLRRQGAQSSLFEIATGIARRNRLRPIVVSSTSGDLVEEYKLNDVDTFLVPFPQQYFQLPSKFGTQVDRLAEFYSKMGSFVHANTLNSFPAILAAKQIGLPSLWNIRESPDPTTCFDHLDDKIKDQAYKCFGLADQVVFVAESTRAVWDSYLANGNAVVIPTGLDIGRLMRPVYGTSRARVRCSLGLGDDDLLLVCVGTVTERKGQADLVEAIGRLSRDVQRHLVVTIVGFAQNEYSDLLRRRLIEYGKKGLRTLAVDETGFESAAAVPEYYLAADMFVSCSRMESFPRVILESMAFSLPIIATPCFGTVEQIVPGESGLTYQPGDIATLAELITRLSRDAALRSNLGAAAYQRTSVLNTYSGMLDRYEEIYFSSINKFGVAK